MKNPGRVFLVGAGPGDPDLLTVKAVRILNQADVVVYDRLVSTEIRKLIPETTRLIPVGKAPNCHPVPQHEINRILIHEALQGHTVARLKGGDPFVFGRGAEEALDLACAGLSVEVVPGISAAQGCSATTGVPLTHRGLASGVRFVTGHSREGRPLELDWDGLADPDTTLVIYMGTTNIKNISAQLIASGLSRRTPVLAINNGTTPSERRLKTDLNSIAENLDREQFSGPVLFIIGRVVNLLGSLNDHRRRTPFVQPSTPQVDIYV